jgi:hypothetical protein
MSVTQAMPRFPSAKRRAVVRAGAGHNEPRSEHAEAAPKRRKYRQHTNVPETLTGVSYVRDVLRRHHAPRHHWQDKRNCQQAVLWLGKQLAFATVDDWYKVRAEDFKKLGLSSLLAHYKSSATTAVLECHPKSKDMLPWRFKTVPTGFWSDAANLQPIAQHIAKQEGFSSIESWYGISKQLMRSHGLTKVLVRMSLRQFVYAAVPEARESLLPWAFAGCSSGYYANDDNLAEMAVYIKKKEGYDTLQGWLELSDEVLARHKLTHLIEHMSIRDFVFRAVPGARTALATCRFTHEQHDEEADDTSDNDIKPEVPRTAREWYSPSALTAMAERIASKEGFSKLEDWYRCDRQTLKRHGLLHVLCNRMSTMEFVLAAVPGAKERLLPHPPEGWYGQTPSVFLDNQLVGLLGRHGGCMLLLLRAMYPDHDWLPFRFTATFFKSTWDTKEVCRQAIEWHAKHTWKITNQKGYYALVYKDFLDAGLSGMIGSKYGGHWKDAMVDLFSELTWDFTKFKGTFWERSGATILKELLSEHKIKDLNWAGERRECVFTDHGDRKRLRLFFDYRFYVPDEDEEKRGVLCYAEYDGRQHFGVLDDGRDTVQLLKTRNERDQIKEAHCARVGAHLLRMGSNIKTVAEMKTIIVQFVADVRAALDRGGGVERIDRRLPAAQYQDRDAKVALAVKETRPV